VHRYFLSLAAATALLAVALGAFGAHGLRGHLTEVQWATYHTAVDYQMWHALGLGLIGLLIERHPNERVLVKAGGLIFGGIVLFSGSLYLLSLTGARWLGMVTPFGGAAFIGGWLLLALGVWRLDRGE
jgi:uncharacterized membrane protein YgdD (TMEM256/DUF423 family)